MSFYSFARPFCLFFFKLFFKATIVGKSNINSESGGLVLVSNHRSYWDPVVLGLYCKRRLFFMAKKELFAVPVFGSIIRMLGAFPVDRGSRDGHATRCAKKTITLGRILAMFPEGTRSKTGEILEFKLGAVKIAAACGCKVVPCSISYFKGRLRRRVFLEYGEAVSLRQLMELDENLQGAVDLENLPRGVLVEINHKLRNLVQAMNKKQKELG